MKIDYYTNGIDRISIKQKGHSGYLVKDKNDHTFLLSNLRGYRLIDDNKSIKEWYEDSVTYFKKHPLAAVITGLSVFFGLINY